MNRKILAVVFFFILFPTPYLFGQKRASIMFFGMPERTYLIYEKDKQTTSLLKKAPSYSIAPGIMIRNELKNRWHINYGCYYSFQAQKYNLYYTGVIFPEKTILSYFKVPLLLQYNIIDRKNGLFFMQAGPQVSVNIIQEGAIIKLYDIVEAGGAYKSMVFDGVFSIGAERKIYKNIYYTIQLRFDHSLSSVNNRKYKNLDSSGGHQMLDVLWQAWGKEYNMTLGLLNGINIKFR